MAISAQRGEPFLFYITPPVVLRVLGLVYAGLVLLGTAYVGLPTLSRRLNHPAPWLLDIMLAGWVLFWVLLPLRLVFPSLASQARLEIRHDGLRFVPRRVIRYFGEVVDKVAVNPESTEILLCQSFYLDIPDGYRMVVRGAHEPDREIDVKFFKTPDAQDCPTIIEGVTKATGLPVRLVIRRRLADGTVQEMPWIPITRKARTARDFAVTTVAAVPYVGGIIVGYLRPPLTTIVMAGLALWLGQLLAMFVCARWLRITVSASTASPNNWQKYDNTKQPKVYAFSTVLTFGAVYGLAVAVVADVLRAH
jgi:hypothetical protein